MAEGRISRMTAITDPAAGDLVEIVDISESSVSQKNKKITLAQIKTYVNADSGGGGGGGVGIFAPVTTTSLMSAIEEEDLSGKNRWIINAGHNLYEYRSDSSATVDNASVFTAAVGRWHLITSSSGSTSDTYKVIHNFTVTDPAQRTYTLPGDKPDIPAGAWNILNIGGMIQQEGVGLDYTVTDRAFTILGTDPVLYDKIQFIYGIKVTEVEGEGLGFIYKTLLTDNPGTPANTTTPKAVLRLNAAGTGFEFALPEVPSLRTSTVINATTSTTIIDLSNAEYFHIKIQANTTLSIDVSSFPAKPKSYMFVLENTGNFTLSYSTQFQFSANAKPPLTLGAGSVDILYCTAHDYTTSIPGNSGKKMDSHYEMDKRNQ